MAYPTYLNNNQYYMQSLEDMRNRIDNQIRQYQQNQMQIQQPAPQVTQNFQLAPAPTNNELEAKYASNIDDVKNTFVIKTGIFIDKDFSNLWIKDVSGNVRTFKIEEIIEIDDKDKEIMALKEQIEEMRGMIANATKYDNSNIVEPDEDKKSQRVSNNKRTNAK